MINYDDMGIMMTMTMLLVVMMVAMAMTMMNMRIWGMTVAICTSSCVAEYHLVWRKSIYLKSLMFKMFPFNK